MNSKQLPGREVYLSPAPLGHDLSSISLISTDRILPPGSFSMDDVGDYSALICSSIALRLCLAFSEPSDRGCEAVWIPHPAPSTWRREAREVRRGSVISSGCSGCSRRWWLLGFCSPASLPGCLTAMTPPGTRSAVYTSPRRSAHRFPAGSGTIYFGLCR